MATLLKIAGVVWILAGLLVFAGAKSAIHEILGCLAASFALMFWGLASLVEHMQAAAGSFAEFCKTPPKTDHGPQPAESPRDMASIERAIAEVRADRIR